MWDHEPTADELLDARIQDGWEPTPTSTTAGAVIMGHACTRFGRYPDQSLDPSCTPAR